MAVDIKRDARLGEHTSRSGGNGHGRPIVPVLAAVAVVIAFIAIYRIGTGTKNRHEVMSANARVTGTYQVPYQVSSTATTAIGQDVRGMPTGTSGTTRTTSVANSSSMPSEAAPMRSANGALVGHNWVAPPEPTVMSTTQPGGGGAANTNSMAK